jgi:hypothetical protein
MRDGDVIGLLPTLQPSQKYGTIAKYLIVELLAILIPVSYYRAAILIYLGWAQSSYLTPSCLQITKNLVCTGRNEQCVRIKKVPDPKICSITG